MSILNPPDVYESWRQQALPVYREGIDIDNFLGHNVVPPPWSGLTPEQQLFLIEMVSRNEPRAVTA